MNVQTYFVALAEVALMMIVAMNHWKSFDIMVKIRISNQDRNIVSNITHWNKI